MTTIEARGVGFDMGRVISGTFGSVGRNATTFFVLALVLVGLPQAILRLLQGQLSLATTAANGGTVSPGQLATSGMLVFVVAILSLIMATLLQAAVIRCVVEDLNGRKMNIADALSAGLRVAPPLIAISIMVGLGVFFGALLLLVPGLMLAVRWAVAIPARVMEQPGVFAAMRRSAELTKGHRWAIFGLGFVFFIGAVVVSAVVGGVTGALAITGGAGALNVASSPLVAAVAALAAAATSMIGAAGIATVYCELRAIKEGASPASLAAVFD